MRKMAPGPCPAAHIEVRQISDHEWRVGDGRADEMSADKILGFIQVRENNYEVFNIKAPGHDLIFDGWEAALASFVAESETERRGKILPQVPKRVNP